MDFFIHLVLGFIGGCVGAWAVMDVRRRLDAVGERRALGPASGSPLAAGTRSVETPMGTFSGRKVPRPPPKPVPGNWVLR